MAAATSTGPISIEQINTTFYVWGGGIGFPTIQAAVDYVRVYNGDLGLVYIVHGHDYSENIATITGGGSAIVILDDRQGANQYWYWNGTQYTPAADVQLAGFVAEGMPLPTTASIAMGFSPTGDFGNGSGNLIVTADPTKGMPSFNLTLDPQDGTGLLTFLRAALNPAGSPRIQMPEALEIYKNTTYPDTYSLWMGQGTDFAGSKGMYVWAKPTENAIDFQGQTIGGAYDQTIRLNYLGGDIFLGANASVGEDGTLTAADVTADSITAGAAVFDTCLVDESPVRTFANTADGPSQGMIWPTIGIPVSAGDHWQNPSIDPATIPRLNTANTFTGLNSIASLHITQAFQATMNNGSSPPVVAPSGGGFALGWNSEAGNGETDFINSNGGIGGGFNWYNVGGGTNIGPSTVPNMWLTSNNVLHVMGGISIAGTPAIAQISIDGLGNADGSGHAGRFASVHPSLTTTAGAIELTGYSSDFSVTASYMQCVYTPGTGSLVTCDGSVTVTNRVFAEQGFIAGGMTFPAANSAANYTSYIGTDSNGQGGVWTKILCTGDGGTRGAFSVYGMAPGGALPTVELLQIADWGTTLNTALHVQGTFVAVGNATFQPGGGNVTIGVSGLTLSWNISGGNGESCFINATAGAGGGFSWYNEPANTTVTAATPANMTLDSTSNLHVAGSYFAGGSKAFKITHPLDETKDLIHACIEGPENGVYYRGEVVTANGEAQVTLPDYFEALTFPEDRSVLLTQIYEDDSDLFSMLMATRVKDGKFKIRSTAPVVKVWWEVKAVRKINVDRLEVERLRFIPQSNSQEEREDAANQQRTEQARRRLNDDAHTNAGAVRTGASEAGEPKPEKVRTGGSGPGSSNRTRKPH